MEDHLANKVTWMADDYQYRSTGAIYKSPVVKIGSNNVIVHPRVAWGSDTSNPKARKPVTEQADRVHMSMLFKHSFSYVSVAEQDGSDDDSKVKKRPSSAPMERINKIKSKLGYSTYTVVPRPSSGKKKQVSVRPASASVVRPPTTIKPGTRPASAASYRGSSAGSQKSVGRQPSELRKSYTLINRAYEEDRYNLDTYATACPDNAYMDRHARCFDHTHIHRQLLRNRPQRVCDNCGVLCESQELLRPGSAAEGREQKVEQPFDRYTSSLRPRSAPAKRNLFPRYNSITRGTIPHFCNFVKKVRLKEKENERPHADHTHIRHRSDEDTSQQGASSNSAQMDSSLRGSHDNVSARPSSPASTAESMGNHGNTGWPKELDADKLSEDSHDAQNSKQEPDEPLDEPAVNQIAIPTDSSSPEPVSPPLSNDITSGDVKLTPIEDDLEKTTSGQLDGQNTGSDHEKDQSKTDSDKDLTEKSTEPAPPPQVNRTLIQPPPVVGKPEEPRNSPYPHQNVPVKKPRAPIVKKEKKPFERLRQQKQEEEVVEVKMEEPPPEPEVVEEVKSPEPPPPPKLEAVVPELPTFKEKEPKSKRRLGSSRGGRQGIKFLSPFDDPDADKDTLENMKEQRKAFELTVPEATKEDFTQQKPRMQSWLQARLALSQQSSRFELPMDVKTLEKMTGQDYLKKHCVISARRSALYHKVHARYKEKGGVIPVKDLDRALQDVLVNTITSEDTRRICELVGLEEDGAVDFKLFAGIAAMAERMLYPKFVTDDTADMKEFKKETIECADFSALDWKLHGIDVNPQVHTILKSL